MQPKPDQLTIARPDDWHLHLRDGAALAAVLPATARQFARAIVMPNLLPPVTTVALAGAYRERILAALPHGLRFEPLMTLYLTETTSPSDIAQAKASGFVHAVKYYPAGATTHSDAGVRDLSRCNDTLAAMQAHDLPLLMHGEVTDPNVDIFDREHVFLAEQLEPTVRAFPNLRIVVSRPGLYVQDADAQWEALREAGANRMARTAWALLRKGEDYRDPAMATA